MKIPPQFNLKLFSITSLYLSCFLELSFLITTIRKCLYLEVIHFPQTLFLPPFTTFSWRLILEPLVTCYCNDLDSVVLVLSSLQKYFHLLFFKPILKEDSCKVQRNWGWDIKYNSTNTQQMIDFESNTKSHRHDDVSSPSCHLATLYFSHQQLYLFTVFIFVNKCLPLGNPDRCWKQPQNIRNWTEYISHRFLLQCPFVFFQWLQRSRPESRFTILMLFLALHS